MNSNTDNASSAATAALHISEFWWTGLAFWVCLGVYSFAKLFAPALSNEYGYIFESLLAVLIVFVAISLSPLFDPKVQLSPTTPTYGRMSTPSETTPSPPHTHRPRGLDDGGSEFANLCHFLTCDGPWCRNKNPRWRCADCHMVYYCSPDCQRAHWTVLHHAHCEPVALGRADTEAQFAVPDQTAMMTTSTTCGLCFKETIESRHPIVLSNCNHTFCFSCIAEFQGESFFVSNRDEACCPMCGTKTNRHVVDEAVSLATKYVDKAQRLSTSRQLSEADVLLRQEWYRLAEVGIEKVLQQEPMHLGALCAKGLRWQEEDPQMAIQIFQGINDVDQRGVAGNKACKAAICEKWDCWVEQGLVYEDGEVELFKELVKQEKQKFYERNELSVLDSGGGPTRLWILHLNLIKAYRFAGRYNEAMRECNKVLLDRHMGSGVEDALTLYYVTCEFALSMYHTGMYEKAIREVHRILAIKRGVAGAYKIIAMALLAMAKQRKTANKAIAVETVRGVQVYTATVDSAIEVMYKGFVYEEQWNDLNTSINREYLQELCDIKASGASIIEESNEKQPERRTNRLSKKKWSNNYY